MKLLSVIGSIILFSVLAFLSSILAWNTFSFSSSIDKGQAYAKGLATIYLYPFAALGVIIGLIVYRLWKNRLFWMLWLVIGAVAVFADRPGDVGGVLFVVLLLAPVFTIPLWQLVMAALWGARTLRGRTTTSSSTS